jgi:hypothetical protein
VFAPQAKKSMQIRPIKRKCAIWIVSFHECRGTVRTNAPHSLLNSQQHPTAAASRYGALAPWCRSTPKTAADLRQLIPPPPERPMCRQAHACDRQLKENSYNRLFSFAPEATAYKLKKTAHNKRASPRKNSTKKKNGPRRPAIRGGIN